MSSGLVRAQFCTWDPLPFFVPVGAAAMAYDPLRQRVVMFGGFFTQDGTGYARETREWDGTRWLARRPLVSPPLRQAAGMSFDSVRGRVVMFGGYHYQQFAGNAILDDMWEYDGQTWQQIPRSGAWPLPRGFPSLGTDPARGRVVLFGGDNAILNILFGDTWEWDGSVWQQITTTTSPTPRYGASMAYCHASRRLMLLGGAPGLRFDYMYEWDGANWTDLSNRPGNPTGFSGMLVSTPWNGHVIRQFSVGVQNNAYVYYNDTWDYDGSTWTQLVTLGRPSFRSMPNICEFPPGQSVLYANGAVSPAPQPAGYYGTDPNDRGEDFWVLSNGDWTRTPTDVRTSFPLEAATYDPVHGRTLVVANPDWQQPAIGQWMETWVLEGDKFRRLQLAVNPPYRVYPRMVRHEGLGKTVLFGGSRYPQNLPKDTWVFDGTQWVEDTATQAPSTNTHSMVYDAARSQIVLLFYDRPDLWAWSGQGWSPWTAGQLPFKPYGICGYDPVRQRLVYFGDLRFSSSTPILRDQLYEFDGTAWQQVPLTTIPPTQMQWTHLTYVPWLGGLVLVPREGWPGVVGPVWVWNGAAWNTVPVDREMYDGMGSFLGTRSKVTYDSARGELQAFSAEHELHATGSYVWRLKSRTLRLSNHHPRLLERLAFSFDAPAQAGQIGIVMLSGSLYPVTPIGAADGRSLPLANDVFLQISLALGLWTTLDAQGRATLQLGAIPNNPSLAGIAFYAAGAIFNPQTMTFSTATNWEPFDINR